MARLGTLAAQFTIGSQIFTATDAGMGRYLVIANAWLSMQAMRSPIATIHFSELVTALASLCLTPVLILIRGIDYHSLDILQEAVLRILRATVTMLPSLTSPPVVPCSGNRPSPDAWWAHAVSEPPNGVNGSMPSCCPTATMAGPLPPLSPAPARRFPLVCVNLIVIAYT